MVEQAKSSVSHGSGSAWPLHKIAEPHERNDVLLSLPQASRKQQGDNKNVPEDPIFWRSTLMERNGSDSSRGNNNNDSGSESPFSRHTNSNEFDYCQGNQRFWELLLSYRDDYERKSKMEKPLVTVQVLNEWRNQVPPGRFLVSEVDTNPPLWKDVGDKKARARISKALKHLSKTSPSSSTPTIPTNLSCVSPTAEERKVLKRVQSDEEKKCSDRQLGQGLVSSQDGGENEKNITHLVQEKADHHCANHLHVSGQNMVPRFQKFDKQSRRISEQLHTAEEDGNIYGRWKERDQLVNIYQRQRQQHATYLQEGETAACTVDFVLISGNMGVGKSSLARTLKNPLIEENNYDSDDDNSIPAFQPPFFLQGKFEHCQWKDANAVYVALVADFCRQLQQRKDPALVKRYREAIEASLKDDLSLLTNLVPALQELWSNVGADMDGSGQITSSASSKRKSSSSPSSNANSYGCMAMQRVKQVFGTFFEVIAAASPSHSVLIVLGDMHYASETALDILSFLVTDKSRCGVLFLGCYRDDEYIEPHFKRAMRQLEANHNVNLNQMHLDNLQEDNVHVMLAETLSLQEDETRSLKALVYSLTKGNPTFINELLRSFQEKGLLQYDETSMQWTCDIRQIPPTIGTVQSISDLFKAKVLELSPSLQETLKIAACLWSTQINESILKMIDTVGAVSAHMKYADMKGLLRYREGHYSFVSDGVKQAIYKLIPEEQRGSYHLRIAQRMWLHLQENQNSEFYATLMSQLFMGDHLIEQEEDRRAVAALYLDAGQKAAKYVGFQTAWYCLSHGISMVSSLKTWGRDNYDLSLSLYNTAIEVCYCNTEFAELEKLIREVLNNARTFEDSLLARSTMIYFLGSRNKQLEAIEMALETLKELGETSFSVNPSIFRIIADVHRLKRLLRGLSDDDILRLPRMKDPKKLGAMMIFNHVFMYTMYAAPKLSVLIVLRMVELTIKHGITAMSSLGICMYGMLLCRFNSIDDGFRYGELALKMCDIFKEDVWLCRTWACFYGAIYCKKYPASEALEPLRNAHRAGLRTGDIEFAVLNACLECFNGCDVMPLPVLESRLRELSAFGDFYGQSLSLIMLKPVWQSVLNFMGRVPGDPKVFKGELIDKDVEDAKEGSNPHFIIWIRFFAMKVAFFFSDYDLAESYNDTTYLIYRQSFGALDAPFTLFYECMVLLAQARRGKRRNRSIRYVRRRLKDMKTWAMHSPSNFLGKQFLLQGELAATCGIRQKALSHYRAAIPLCHEGGFLMEEALANEQLAKYYLEHNDIASAVPFLEAARGLYDKWGAAAKVKHFDETFGRFLE